MKTTLTLSLLFINLNAYALTLFVGDTGVDFRHDKLKPVQGFNPSEIADNGIDEDRNQRKDDVSGWNFQDNNKDPFGYKREYSFTSKELRINKLYARYERGENLNNQDFETLRDAFNDAEFLEDYNYRNNISHGTHVAGIAAKGIKGLSIFSARHNGANPRDLFSLKNNKLNKMTEASIIEFAKEVAKYSEYRYLYTAESQADVYNGSYGYDFELIKRIIKSRFNPTGEVTDSQGKIFSKAYNESICRAVRKFKNTIFVFAAGNDKANNDSSPSLPSNVSEFCPNVISVAAVYKNKLANFSNYGKRTVDVAAPGVAILSSAPGNQMIYASGTSMAAPNVANLALRIKQANPALSGAEVKTIIVETVSKFSNLSDKIRSGGVINTERALSVAKESKTKSLKEALYAAKANFNNKGNGTISAAAPVMQRPSLYVMPMPEAL